jgi:hypothetical protein
VEENIEFRDLVAAAFTLDEELQQTIRGALPILVQAASNCIAMEQEALDSLAESLCQSLRQAMQESGNRLPENVRQEMEQALPPPRKASRWSRADLLALVSVLLALVSVVLQFKPDTQAQEMIRQNEAIIEQLKMDNEKKDEMIELLQDLRDALTSQSAEDVDDQSEDIHRLALAVGQSLEGLQGALVDKDQLAELPENEQE